MKANETKQKLISWIAGAVMTALMVCLSPLGLVYASGNASAPDEIKVTKISCLSDSAKAPMSYSEKHYTEDSTNGSSDYLKFTITEKSVVDFHCMSEMLDIGEPRVSSNIVIANRVILYRDAAYSDVIRELMSGGGGYGYIYDGDYVEPDSRYVVLDKGTYYVKVLSLPFAGQYTYYRQDIKICAMPYKNLISVKMNSSKNKATITLNKKAIGNTYHLRYASGTKTTDEMGQYGGVGKGAKDITKQGKFTAKKNGTYTIYISRTASDGDVSSATAGREAFTFQLKLKDIDTTKPTISGVKNKKTYKKKVTIKFSDKGSGVKKATLNGKKIRSGKKVSKNGSYTVKVWDKAGNLRVVNSRLRDNFGVKHGDVEWVSLTVKNRLEKQR